jgi:hypothetical protein
MNASHEIFLGVPSGALSRRELLHRTGLGLGSLALTWLQGEAAACATLASKSPLELRQRPPHFTPRARAVIMLMQTGGPSNMDLFDRKLELERRSGEAHNGNFETFQQGNTNKLLGSVHPFRRYGACGMELSEILPHIGSIADEICLVRSMVSDNNNHTEAIIQFASGKILPGRPTLGAWISYGLGTENQNLPAFVVLRDPEGFPTSAKLMYQAGLMSPIFGGTEFNPKGTPVQNLIPVVPVSSAVQSRNLEFLAQLNRRHQAQHPHETELDGRIRNYELAARMQLAATEVTDLSIESTATQKLYGLDSANPALAGYARRLLMARRLVEAGVRFVLVFAPVKDANWDHHGDVKGGLAKACAATDQPSAALVKDLKARGLLDSTIVLWGGEFGRLPISQGQGGRDHNRHAGAFWLAGGGFKRGFVYGETDELGYRVVENKVGVSDLHATILRQTGLDHRKLAFSHAGRNETLTDSEVTGAQVVAGLCT